VRLVQEAAKRVVWRTTHAVGFEVKRYRRHARPPAWGRDSLDDIGALLNAVPQPVVFDVGANVGQSVATFRRLLPDCTLHSFEPGPAAFRELAEAVRGLRNVHVVNAGVGSSSGSQTLIENDHSDMSSFLRPSIAAWGAVVAETQIAITTLEDYCTAHAVEQIDLLKIDTQGYELEVLRGAGRMLGVGAISLIYMEITFSEMYEGLPSLDTLYRFLVDSGFRLVAFYDFRMQGNRTASWCDALFAHERFVSRV
jgi:FkbM family methyltransferase